VATNGSALRRRHVGELIGNLASDAGTLVRKEVELAKAELQQTAQSIAADLSRAADADAKVLAGMGQAAGMFGAAAVTALAALGALTAAAILVLNRVMAADLAALLVGIAWVLIAATFALRGRDRLRAAGSLTNLVAALKNAGSAERVVPQQTIETVKEDVQWVKTRGKSDKR
jgi:hypothetical protein